jgi:hypothetical protein
MGDVSGAGTIGIASGGTLTVDGSLTLKALNYLTGGHETAIFGTPEAVTASMVHFIPTDTIELLGFAETGDSYAGGTLTIDGAGGPANLVFAGTGYTQSSFAVTTDGIATFVTHT